MFCGRSGGAPSSPAPRQASGENLKLSARSQIRGHEVAENRGVDRCRALRRPGLAVSRHASGIYRTWYPTPALIMIPPEPATSSAKTGCYTESDRRCPRYSKRRMILRPGDSGGTIFRRRTTSAICSLPAFGYCSPRLATRSGGPIIIYNVSAPNRAQQEALKNAKA